MNIVLNCTKSLPGFTKVLLKVSGLVYLAELQVCAA